VRYGSGPVDGYFSQDDVTIAGYKIQKQIFAEVTDASGLGQTFQVRMGPARRISQPFDADAEK
jgi:hypothetical protein